MNGCITFRNVGRLGNFMFETAAALAYAWEHQMPFSAPTTARPGHPCYFPSLVNPEFMPGLPEVVVKEHGHKFQSLPFQEEWHRKNIVLDGYFQSEKYFLHHRERLIGTFGFQWEFRPGVVSVHIRRTDYLEIKRGSVFKHPPVARDWYERAMATFPGARFKFFSDDIAWCVKNFGTRADCEFSIGRNEIYDLVEGSCCEHHICSASTFSWWQAWLNRNPNKRIVIPTHWLTPGWNGGLDMSDIVPATWDRLA